MIRALFQRVSQPQLVWGRWLLCLSLGSLLVGCRYRDPSIDILEGELRWMEDQLYFLEDELARTCADLERCRQSGSDECGCGDGLPGSGGYSVIDEGTTSLSPYEVVPSDPQPTPALRNRTESPRTPVIPREPGNEQSDADDEFKIEMPTESTSQSSGVRSPDSMMDASGEFEIVEPVMEVPQSSTTAPSPDGPALEATPTLATPTLASPDGATVEPVPATEPTDSDLSIRLQSFADPDQPSEAGGASGTIDAHVTHVVAEGRLANARDFDNRNTDADLLVIVEPRNADGQYVALAGPLSIVVLDGKAEGTAARVARWDFDAASVRRRFRSSPEGQGAHFSLTWPEATPQSDQLYLFVRYVNVEGRKLEVDVPLTTEPQADGPGQWRVVKPKHELTTWSVPTRSKTLTPRSSAVKLEPIPEDDLGDRAPEASGDPTPEKQPEPRRSVEMPRRVGDQGAPEWSPDR